MWKGPLAKSRCLVPAVGWYEWKPVERMPVVLSKDAEAGWLDPKITDAEQAMAIAREHGVTEIEYHRVTSRVNIAKSDDEELIEAVTGDW